MSKFKVGDRVRKVNGSKFSAWADGIEVVESTVSRITLKGYPQVAHNGFAYYDHELELLPAEAKFKFKVGDKVQRTNGAAFLGSGGASFVTGTINSASNGFGYEGYRLDNNLWYGAGELKLVPVEAEPTPEPETYAVGDTVVLKRTGTVVRLAAQSVYSGEVITPGPNSIAVVGAVKTFSRGDIEKKYDAAVAEATQVWKDAREAHEAAEKEADRLGKIRDAAYMALADANNNR